MSTPAVTRARAALERLRRSPASTSDIETSIARAHQVVVAAACEGASAEAVRGARWDEVGAVLHDGQCPEASGEPLHHSFAETGGRAVGACLRDHDEALRGVTALWEVVRGGMFCVLAEIASGRTGSGSAEMLVHYWSRVPETEALAVLRSACAPHVDAAARASAAAWPQSGSRGGERVVVTYVESGTAYRDILALHAHALVDGRVLHQREGYACHSVDEDGAARVEALVAAKNRISPETVVLPRGADAGTGALAIALHLSGERDLTSACGLAADCLAA